MSKLAPEEHVLRTSVKNQPWFLYMIECENGSIYTGIATDVAARYAAHVSGKGAKYTRANKPRELLLAVRYQDRSTASRAEYEFKQLPAAQKRQWITKGLALASEQAVSAAGEGVHT
jgi:putative endonuclease